MPTLLVPGAFMWNVDHCVIFHGKFLFDVLHVIYVCMYRGILLRSMYIYIYIYVSLIHGKFDYHFNKQTSD